jgi:hypothetical protein
VTTLGPGRRQSSEGRATVKIVTLFMYGLFYDALSSSDSVHVGKNVLHNRQRALEEVKTKCQGPKSPRPSSAFCATVCCMCVCVFGGGETGVSGEDSAPVPRCSIGVSRGDVVRSDRGLRGEERTSCHLSCETSVLCSECCSCLRRRRFVSKRHPLLNIDMWLATEHIQNGQ